jgi:hypothetical protein
MTLDPDVAQSTPGEAGSERDPAYLQPAVQGGGDGSFRHGIRAGDARAGASRTEWLPFGLPPSTQGRSVDPVAAPAASRHC